MLNLEQIKRELKKYNFAYEENVQRQERVKRKRRSEKIQLRL